MMKKYIMLSGFILSLGTSETMAAAEVLPDHDSSKGVSKTTVLDMIDADKLSIKAVLLADLPIEPSKELGWESLCSMYKKLAILYEVEGDKDSAAESLYRAINIADGRDFNLNEKLSALGLDSYPSKEKILAAIS